MRFRPGQGRGGGREDAGHGEGGQPHEEAARGQGGGEGLEGRQGRKRAGDRGLQEGHGRVEEKGRRPEIGRGEVRPHVEGRDRRGERGARQDHEVHEGRPGEEDPEGDLDQGQEAPGRPHRPRGREEGLPRRARRLPRGRQEGGRQGGGAEQGEGPRGQVREGREGPQGQEVPRPLWRLHRLQLLQARLPALLAEQVFLPVRGPERREVLRLEGRGEGVRRCYQGHAHPHLRLPQAEQGQRHRLGQVQGCREQSEEGDRPGDPRHRRCQEGVRGEHQGARRRRRRQAERGQGRGHREDPEGQGRPSKEDGRCARGREGGEGHHGS
mmetsp:Transcript_138047/g.429055  ORF Transcript_138047/g.429055 Transcript_138047/m.429055 type:complete len:325 (-) Transcript_138047:280-1254(-)